MWYWKQFRESKNQRNWSIPESIRQYLDIIYCENASFAFHLEKSKKNFNLFCGRIVPIIGWVKWCAASRFGSGVAGRGRPSWDGGGRRTVKDDGRKTFFDSVRLKDESGRRTDNFLSQADRGGRRTGISSASRTIWPRNKFSIFIS